MDDFYYGGKFSKNWELICQHHDYAIFLSSLFGKYKTQCLPILPNDLTCNSLLDLPS